MARLVRAQVTLPKDGGIPADAITNTWHWYAPNDGELNGDEAADIVKSALNHFYNDVIANGYSPGMLLSENLDGSQARIKVYDLADAKPRAPIMDDALPIVVGTGDSLPSEVALCLSYQASQVAGIKQSRRRGRIFLGPMATAAAAMAGNEPRPDAFACQLIADAGKNLVDFDQDGSDWVVFSGASADKKPPQAADAHYTVDNVWVDNSWDTQRSRGPKATVRYVGV